MPDWQAIKKEYEEGQLSTRSLATKYGIAQSTMMSRATKEQWQRTKQPAKPPVRSSAHKGTPPTPIRSGKLNETSNERSDRPDATGSISKQQPPADNMTVPIATLLIKKVGQRVISGEELAPKDLKMLADALSAANRIVTTAPVEEAEIAPYDIRTFLSYCLPEELEIIRPIINAVQARKDEQEAKIKPIRRLS